MATFLRLLAKVSGPWSLAAYAIAAIVYIVLRRRGRMPAIAWGAIAAIVALGLAPLFADTYVKKEGIYRVRVNVLEGDHPLEDAKIWSSLGGEPKKVSGGWEIDIPRASRPSDGKLSIYGEVESMFLGGQAQITLGDELNPPPVPLHLKVDNSATITGVARDESDDQVLSATVISIDGGSSIQTDENGHFTVAANAPKGKMVYVRARKSGYAAAAKWGMAGDTTFVIELRQH